MTNDDICKNNHGGADTSMSAWESAKQGASNMRQKIRRLIASAGYCGKTCEEVELELGIKHQTASARISELRRDGLIVYGEQRRATSSGSSARVYLTNRSTTTQ